MSRLDIPYGLQHALALHQEGRLDEAIVAYLGILATQPDEHEVLRLLGLAHFQQGRLTDALDRLTEALAVQPHSVDANYHRGLVLKALHRPHDALADFDRAIEAAPRRGDLRLARGGLLFALGRAVDALVDYDRLLEINPANVTAWCNRGSVLQSVRRLEEALASYERALAVDSRNLDALCGHARALIMSTRYDEAVAACDVALGIRAGHALAHKLRADALSLAHRHADAISDYDQAIAAAPRDVEALINRANALHALALDNDAVRDLDRALEISPVSADALFNRGIVLTALGRESQALDSYRAVLETDPQHAPAAYATGLILLKQARYADAYEAFRRVLAIDPEFPYALGYAAHAKGYLCDWDGLDAMSAKIEQSLAVGKPVSHPFPLFALSSDPAIQLACARLFARDVSKDAQRAPTVLRGQHRSRLRVAYLSSKFHDHPGSQLIVGVLERHDRSRFDITGISFGPHSAGAMRTRLEACFDRFVDVRAVTDGNAAALIEDLGIDIAVDLVGYGRDLRTGILAHRPAPIQVSYLGYPCTMGADFIDYLVADRFIIPESQRDHYSEKIVYLPDSYQANDSQRTVAAGTPTRRDANLPENAFVFCSFNNSYKILPDVFDVWMRLLRRVPASVLWLLSTDASADTNLRREAEARGVSADRIVFARRIAVADHLARHALADLFLDTLPCNAHTSASDALWMHLPVLTCAGTTFAGRVAGSLLHAVGLAKLVTHNLQDYETLAARLATNPAELGWIRGTLASNRDNFPLFDTERTSRHLEAAYATMWEIHERGEPPRSFAVASEQA